MLVYNGKYGGGRMVLNPMAILNDGYFEMLFYKNLIGFTACLKLFDGAKKGGTHIYDNKGSMYRVKKLKLINKSAHK
jgi:diacylglycerol kinase family enzyme